MIYINPNPDSLHLNLIYYRINSKLLILFEKNHLFGLLFFIGFKLSISAQDFNFDNYNHDSSYHHLVIKNKIKSVREFQTMHPTGILLTRAFQFDKMGRVIASYNINASGQKKVMYDYSSDGKLVKKKYFADNDTSVLSYWIEFEYDQEGNPVQETTAFYDAQGKYHEDITQMEILCKSENKTVRKTTATRGDMFLETTFLIDSVFKKYRFEIKIKKEGLIKNDSASRGSNVTKTVKRLYSKNNEECEDEIEYSILDGIQKLVQFYTICSKFDTNKRKIESVTTNFKNGIEEYIINEYATNESNAASKKITPAMLTESLPRLLEYIDKGMVKGEVEEAIKYNFNKSGLLQEINTRRSNVANNTSTAYTYNKNSQIIESITKIVLYDEQNMPITSGPIYDQMKPIIEELQLNNPTRKVSYLYNDRGLLSNIRYYTINEQTKKETITNEEEYKYEYFK